jgi:hypothetical protein
MVNAKDCKGDKRKMNCNDCCYNLPKDGYSYCTYEDGECIKISMLEKENAELKNKLEHRNCLDCSNHSSNLRMKTLELEKECTKAKEIIKKFSEFVNNGIEYDPEHPQEHTNLWNKLCEEAKHFFKDCEVEK